MESKRRSLVKSISWRVLGDVILGGIAWGLTRNWEITTAVTVLFHAVQIFLYYFHERVWDRVEWGLKNKDELTEKEKQKVMERLRRLGYID